MLENFLYDDRLTFYNKMKIEYSIFNIEYWAADRTICQTKHHRRLLPKIDVLLTCRSWLSKCTMPEKVENSISPFQFDFESCRCYFRPFCSSKQAWSIFENWKWIFCIGFDWSWCSKKKSPISKVQLKAISCTYTKLFCCLQFLVIFKQNNWEISKKNVGVAKAKTNAYMSDIFDIFNRKN